MKYFGSNMRVSFFLIILNLIVTKVYCAEDHALSLKSEAASTARTVKKRPIAKETQFVYKLGFQRLPDGSVSPYQASNVRTAISQNFSDAGWSVGKTFPDSMEIILPKKMSKGEAYLLYRATGIETINGIATPSFISVLDK